MGVSSVPLGYTMNQAHWFRLVRGLSRHEPIGFSQPARKIGNGALSVLTAFDPAGAQFEVQDNGSAAASAAPGVSVISRDLISPAVNVPDATGAVASATAYVQHNLISDIPNFADHTDPNLVNPWGISFSATGPFWISDFGTGLTTVYTSDGDIRPLVVKIALPPGVSHPAGITGQIENPTKGFVVNGSPSTFIFATAEGTISGWNGASGTSSVLMVDNSSSGAVYKGLAIATLSSGAYIYAANFHSGQIDVFDSKFAATKLSGSFTDPALPAGFAPFNIQNLGGVLYVTYAKQDSNRFNDVAGPGNGFVDAFDTSGNLQQRVVSNGPLNSPWGIQIAPASFGIYSNALLVGNFGDGFIHAFDVKTGALLGQLQDSAGKPIKIDGLWGLQFGNGGSGGDRDALYFSAGISGQTHGLFGCLLAIAPGEPEVRTTLDPGFYVADVNMQPDQRPGEWGMVILFDRSDGGFDLGGAFGPSGRNSGFGAFALAKPGKVSLSLSTQLIPGELVGPVTMQILNSQGNAVGSPLQVTDSGSATVTLDPDFYVVSVTSSAAAGTFQLGIGTDQSIQLGGIAGGYLTRNVTGFGAFYLGTRQRVRILTFGQGFYSPFGTGQVQLTLRDASGAVRTSVH